MTTPSEGAASPTWATGSLLDPTNVGKTVLVSWNGNRPDEATIVKVGRTNGSLVLWARWRHDPGYGHRGANGFGHSVYTHEWDTARRVKAVLSQVEVPDVG